VTCRCRGLPLSTTVVLVHERDDDEEPAVYSAYPNPGLEAELAYRRELLSALGRTGPTRRGPWLSRRRRRAA
jgi:hypothetical protein